MTPWPWYFPLPFHLRRAQATIVPFHVSHVHIWSVYHHCCAQTPLDTPRWRYHLSQGGATTSVDMVIYPTIYDFFCLHPRWLFGISEPSTVWGNCWCFLCLPKFCLCPSFMGKNLCPTLQLPSAFPQLTDEGVSFLHLENQFLVGGFNSFRKLLVNLFRKLLVKSHHFSK